MKKINISEIIFYVSYTIALFALMFESVNVISKFTSCLLYLAYFLLLHIYIIQSKKYAKKDILKIIVITICGIMSWYYSKNASLMILFGFLFAEKNIDFKKLVKYDFKVKLFLLLVIVCLFKLGLTGNYSVYRDGILRSSMGFSHPNKFGAYILSLYTEFVYLFFNKNKKATNLTVTILSVCIISHFCDSRASAICILILYVCMIILKNNKFRLFDNKLFKKCIICVFAICSFLSISFGYFYNPNNDFLHSLNSSLSGRLSYTHLFFKKYNINLFGNRLELVSNMEATTYHIQAWILDNSYVRILLQYGVISFSIFSVIYILSLRRSLEKKDYVICIILIIYCIRGLADNIMFAFNINTFLLYFSSIIYTKKEIKNND